MVVSNAIITQSSRALSDADSLLAPGGETRNVNLPGVSN